MELHPAHAFGGGRASERYLHRRKSSASPRLQNTRASFDRTIHSGNRRAVDELDRRREANSDRDACEMLGSGLLGDARKREPREEMSTEPVAELHNTKNSGGWRAILGCFVWFRDCSFRAEGELARLLNCALLKPPVSHIVKLFPMT